MATVISACQLAHSKTRNIVNVSGYRNSRITIQRRVCLPLPRASLDQRESTSTSTPTIPKEPELIPSWSPPTDKPTYTIKCVLEVQKKTFLDLINIFADFQDDLADILGRKVRVQLISQDVDPDTGYSNVSAEIPVPGWIFSNDGFAATREGIQYTMEFTVPKDFGKPGAILIRNQHPSEFILRFFKIVLPDETTLDFNCDSWLYPSSDKSPRVFFIDELYLPKDTPPGLIRLRARDLNSLRGEGIGERVTGERIYGYDVYNDLGNPDVDKELSRPVLGGRKLPYPRRGRTGRKPTKSEAKSESIPGRLGDMYVPVDEEFRRVKNSNFLGDAVKAFAHQVKPGIRRFFRQSDTFRGFKDLFKLYDIGIDLGKEVKADEELIKENRVTSPFTLINQLTVSDETNGSLLRYPLPGVVAADRDAWMLDYEFARQTLAGLNPLTIKLLKTFPPTSELDTETYGEEASALKPEHIDAARLEGLTIEEALEKKKLFILDYHDIFLPYVGQINKLEGRALYATRTIFFLNRFGILETLAIELSLPHASGTGQRINRVLVPPTSAKKKDWLWELAKAHVGVNDSGFHQLVSHWLRTHACMEPFVIATHRNLSVIHPIKNLLLPHFKYTMAINARARSSLINSGGIIEENFAPGKYSLEMSAVVYGLMWRFDQQALPTDLISRGLATPNPEAEHGLDLVIPDYPYAVDGLDLWKAIKDYVTDYTNIFYTDDAAVEGDTELRSWWQEVVNVGHGDKRNEEGWPEMKTKAELVEAVTTIIWIGSGHHAAVNFGQYAYSGFPPTKPTIAHRLVPTEGSKEHDELMKDPQKFYFETISKKSEATTIMTTVELLSTHSEEEEYLGCERTKFWTSNQAVRDAYAKFQAALKDAEEQAEARNEDPRFYNRRGSVKFDYTLLHVSSGPGITGRGVPNSISI